MKFLLLTLIFSTMSFAGLNKTNVTVADLEEYLTRNQTVEKFISNLSVQTRSQYVLMHSSKSLQSADYQRPRVIMYSKTGQMLLSFTDSSQKNGDKIEVILFDPEERKFSAHEIDFSLTIPKLNRNPQKCLSCHGQDLRPNWNTYSFWDGAYGGNDSRLSRPGPNGALDITEYLEIQKFVKTYKGHPRYRYLEKLEDQSTPADGIVPKASDRHDSSRVKSKNLEELTLLVTQMNNRRVRRILEAHPQFGRFKFAFLALMSCEEDQFKRSLPENFSMSVDESFPYLSYRYDHFSLGKIRDRYYAAFLNALGINHQFLDTTFNLEYPVDRFGEDDTVGLTTSKFSTGSYPQYEFAYEWTDGDADFEAYLYPKDHQGRVVMVKCDELALRANDELRLIRSENREENVLQVGKRVFETTCMRCHSRPEITTFQFNAKNLRELFLSDPNLARRFDQRLDMNSPVDKRMPLGMDISTVERQAVKEYIKSFRP